MDKKVLYLAVMLLCLISSTMDAQKSSRVAKTDKIYEDPDIMPMFVGGTNAMNKFIVNALQYPEEAKKQDLQGLVVYKFVVEKDGTLSNFELIRQADQVLNDEALRILKSMPPWRPAKNKGEIVRAKSFVPMYFKFNKQSSKRCAKGNNGVNNDVYAKTDKSVIENNEIYTIVDKMPQYAYGEEGLSKFIAWNMRYPKEMLQNGIQGRILCSFIVGADGSISNIEVVRGISPQLDSEAVRILGVMPKWIPGEKDGKKVNVKCLLPIDFKIEEEPVPAIKN